jgi:hypothetical protein
MKASRCRAIHQKERDRDESANIFNNLIRGGVAARGCG